MSKVANMLNMVEYLQDGKVHSIADISSKLEVKPRMIRQYKIELEQAGIYITSTTGKYGGYQLEKEKNHIDVGLTNRDITILEKVEEDIREVSLQEDYKRVTQRIKNAYLKNIREQDGKKLEELKSNSKTTIEEIYMTMRKAIHQKCKVQIVYYSINTHMTKRIIHPAELFQYKQQWHVAAFCELRKEIRLFKLENIIEYTLLSEIYDENISINQ